MEEVAVCLDPLKRSDVGGDLAVCHRVTKSNDFLLPRVQRELALTRWLLRSFRTPLVHHSHCSAWQWQQILLLHLSVCKILLTELVKVVKLRKKEAQRNHRWGQIALSWSAAALMLPVSSTSGLLNIWCHRILFSIVAAESLSFCWKRLQVGYLLCNRFQLTVFTSAQTTSGKVGFMQPNLTVFLCVQEMEAVHQKLLYFTALSLTTNNHIQYIA